MTRPRVLVAGAGAGGEMGRAVLHGWLGRGRVTVLTTHRFLRMPAGMTDAVVHAGDWRTAPLAPVDHAVLLFGGLRRAREAAFWRPARADLVPLAAALRARGARTLELVLADGDGLHAAERALLQPLGFERITEVEPLAVTRRPATGSWPERLAACLLATLWAAMRQVMRRQR